jgi:hypothetical protein
VLVVELGGLAVLQAAGGDDAEGDQDGEDQQLLHDRRA